MFLTINRNARHAFWDGSYRNEKRFRRRLGLVGFLLVCLAVALLGLVDTAKPATWDGARWNCPAGSDVYADEQDARAGRDFVYCVK